MIVAVKIELVGQRKVIWLPSHRVSVLAHGKSWVVGNSSACTDKGPILKFSRIANDSFSVSGCMDPHNVGWGERHDPLRPKSSSCVFLGEDGFG